ncbi:hypothetical protein MKEN_00831700 [Mycena kentingensis (nom. inval.)]|nr:hypothetical protein MKEN_00831700 [Mycena kentingensis (nom. inval.)]
MTPPRIEGDIDLSLEVYTHASLKQGWSANPEYGDFDRLLLLGGSVIEQTLIAHYFRQQPLLSAPEITAKIATAITPDKLKEWAVMWQLATKYRAAPGVCDILEAPDEIHSFFKATVAALYLRNPPRTAENWIISLIDPDAAPPPPPTVPPPVPVAAPSAHYASPPQIFNNGLSTPPPAAPGLTLQKIHEAATKYGATVAYSNEHAAGPSHAPVWRVNCRINGEIAGTATAASLKAAKEQAARAAYVAKGWSL